MWVVNATPRPYFTPGKDPVPIVQEAGWASGSVWTGAENLGTTEIRSPNRPASSESLRLNQGDGLAFPPVVVKPGSSLSLSQKPVTEIHSETSHFGHHVHHRI